MEKIFSFFNVKIMIFLLSLYMFLLETVLFLFVSRGSSEKDPRSLLPL
jgi:hypothetical protein